MGDTKKREFSLGIVMLLAGVGYLWMTSLLPRRQFIDAAFVPYVLGMAMCLLGVLQLRAAKALLPQGPTLQPAQRTDNATVWKTIALITAYIALLNPVGFPIMTVLYLFIQFIVLTPAGKKINFVSYGVIAVIASAAIFLTFRYALDLLLPLGLLN